MTRPSGARSSSVGTVSASQARSVTSKTSPRRFDAVSSGPNRRNVSGFRDDHVAQERAEHARRLARLVRRLLDRRPRSRGSRAGRDRAGARRRSRAGSRSCAARRAARAPRAPAEPAAGVEELLRAVAPQPLLEERAGARGSRGRRASGTWCERHVPSTWTPSTSRGPVQPFGVRRTIIGQRGRRGDAPSARCVLDRRDLVERVVERRGERAGARRRAGSSSPSTSSGRQP